MGIKDDDLVLSSNGALESSPPRHAQREMLNDATAVLSTEILKCKARAAKFCPPKTRATCEM